MTDDVTPVPESKWYAHYKASGFIIGTEYTNHPSKIEGATRIEVDEEVYHRPQLWRVDVATGQPARIT